MKKLLFLLLLILLIGSCTVSKHKTKEKNDTSITNEIQNSETSSIKDKSIRQNNRSDSTASNANYNIDRSKTATLQNFSLKNNGKCTDPGSTRYVHFIDVLGNKTSIPVNDNTDLNFVSESEMKKEVESVKTENVNLKKEIETLKKDKQALTVKQAAQKSNIRVKASKTDVETEKYSFWSFILVGVLFIVVWETIKGIIKKYRK